MPKLVVLWTDAALWALVVALALYARHVARTPNLRATWGKVLRDAPALSALVVFALFAAVALLDSGHFRRALPS
ncbi:MAG: ABC transporter permease, partial [Rubrivivax sp.]|nr:ABC transporter permease [Rubrivivax sp.]